MIYKTLMAFLILTVFTTMLGLIFKLNHYNFANETLITGTAMILFFPILLAFVYLRKKIKTLATTVVFLKVGW